MNERKKINNLIELPKSKTTIFILLFTFILLNTYIVLNMCYKETAKKDIFRLHVVANSNDTSDQIIKLKVSNKIEEYLKTLNLKDKKNTLDTLTKNKDEILAISNNILKENNINYASTLNIGKINYNEKEKLEISMEKGVYDSMQIVLGNGEGKNFWSLIFPNKENIDKLKTFETILPGISTIYQEDTASINNVEYDFKIREMLDFFKTMFK